MNPYCELKITLRDNPVFVATRSASMLDMILLAAGCGCFAVAVAYSYACDRL
jgi:hypothetical protein